MTINSAPEPRMPVNSIGETVRRLRKAAGMTLQDVAIPSRLSVSAVSKIENGVTSPTFDTLTRLAVGLDVEISVLFGGRSEGGVSGRRVITRANMGVMQSTAQYEYQMLCSDLATKAFIPLLTRISARSIDDFKALHQHTGEEFFYVISGQVGLYTEHYAPAVLDQGDCSYFDSSMGHALISLGETDAMVLWVTTGVHGELEKLSTAPA